MRKSSLLYIVVTLFSFNAFADWMSLKADKPSLSYLEDEKAHISIGVKNQGLSRDQKLVVEGFFPSEVTSVQVNGQGKVFNFSSPKLLPGSSTFTAKAYVENFKQVEAYRKKIQEIDAQLPNASGTELAKLVQKKQILLQKVSKARTLVETKSLSFNVTSSSQPGIQITSPAQGAEVNSNLIVIQGSVEAGTTRMTFQGNNVEIEELIFNGETSFTSPSIFVRSGTNNILVRAYNGEVQTHEKQLTIVKQGDDPLIIGKSLKVEIAGQKSVTNMSADKSGAIDYEWDGKNSAGEEVCGSVIANIEVEQKYNFVMEKSWAAIPTIILPGMSKKPPKGLMSKTELEKLLTGIVPKSLTRMGYPTISKVALGTVFCNQMRLGGWDISIRHFYDDVRKTLYLGDGNTYSTSSKEQTNGDHWIVSSDRSEIFVFNSNFRHYQTLNALNGSVKLNLNYDTEEKLISVVDANQNATTIQYSDDRIASITSPYGHVTQIDSDENGYISSVTNPASETFEIAYTPDGLLETFQKPSGVTSTMTYDGDGRLLSDTSSAGSRTELFSTETVNERSITQTSAMGRIIQYLVTNGEDRYTRVQTSPDSLVRTYTVDNLFGTVENRTTPTGYRTLERSQPDPRFGGDSKMPLTYTVYDAGRTNASVYNESCNLSNPNDPFSYSVLTSSWTTNNKISQSEFSSTTNTKVETSPAGRVTTSILDAQARPVSVQKASYTPVTSSFDNRGRLETTSQGNNRSTAFTYTAGGSLGSIENPLGQITSFTYDQVERMLTQTLPDNRVISYSYDADGNLASVTPPSKPTHGMSYNGFGLLSTYTPPLLTPPSTVATTYYYNNDRQLIQITRPDTQTIGMNYNAITGLLDSTYLPTGNRTFEYDDGTLRESVSEDFIRRRTTVTGTKITIDSVEIENETDFFSYQIVNDYNNDLIQTTEGLSVGFTSGQTIEYTYDNDGLIVSAEEESITRAMDSGLISQIALGNIEESYTYSSSFGELSSFEALFNSTVLYEESMTRDNLGRIVTKTERYGTSNPSIYEYTYDSAGRLSSVTVDSNLQTTYGYDSNSNRISSETATYDNQDRLLTYGNLSFTYNQNGEATSVTDSLNSETINYAYDVMGNIKSVVLPTVTISYQVDAHDRRIVKRGGSTVLNYYIWNSDNRLIATADASGMMTARFVYGSKSHIPDYMLVGSARYKIITDHLGSPVLVVNTQNGTIAQEVRYNEFGVIMSDSSPGFTPFGFAGCLYDQDTKLCRFGARDYNPSIGRWLSKDPTLFAGGDTNLYGYVLNDPINAIDPKGTISPASITSCAVMFAAGELYDMYSNFKDQSELQKKTEAKLAALDKESKSCSSKRKDQIRFEKDKIMKNFQMKSGGNVLGAFTPGEGAATALAGCMLALGTF